MLNRPLTKGLCVADSREQSQEKAREKWFSMRRVLVSGELNQESLKKVGQDLIRLETQSNETITLLIESGGGKVLPTHQLEDLMSALHSPIDAVVIGNCASMAVDLVQMCRKRIMLPSARILVHYLRNDQMWICDDFDLLEKDIVFFRERMKENAERRMNLYMKRTGHTEEKIKEIFRQGEIHGMAFTAKQAVALRLVDSIAEDFKLFPPFTKPA